MCTAKFRGLCNKSCSDKCQRLVFTKDVQICALKAIGRSVNLKIVTIFSLIILGIGNKAKAVIPKTKFETFTFKFSLINF